MARTVVKTITSVDGSKRVLLVRRDDGAYVFIPQRWYSNVHEGKLIAEGWADIPAHTSFFQSEEMAEREARAELRWLS